MSSQVVLIPLRIRSVRTGKSFFMVRKDQKTS